MYRIWDLVEEETINGKTFVTLKVKTEADEIAFKTITYSKPAFVAPITLSEENGMQTFSFDVLANRFTKLNALPHSMKPVEFLLFMKNLTEAVINCDDYFMDPRNLLIFEDYTYINPDNFDVRLIYAPFCDTIFTDADMRGNIYKISRKFAKTTNDEWKEVITRLWNMSENMSAYEAYELYDALYGEYNGRNRSDTPHAIALNSANNYGSGFNAPVNTSKQGFALRQDAPAAPPAISEKERKKNGLFAPGEKKEPKKQEKGGMFSGKNIAGGSAAAEAKIEKPVKEKPVKEKSKGGLFSLKKDKELKKEANPPEPVYPAFDNTEIDFGNATQIDIFAKFQYIGNNSHPRIIAVDVPEGGAFTIGRFDVSVGVRQSNFEFDKKTKAVSRRHAAIKRDADGYFIVDLSSSAGTYLNGKKLPPNTPVKLENGSCVSFGNSGADYVWDE